MLEFRRCLSYIPLIFALFAPWQVQAQATDTTDYFPLEVGNTWRYFQVLNPPGAPPDTLWRGTYTITGEISINDTLYYVSEYPFSLADTLRTDEQGRTWARVHGQDVLLFDFGLNEGETYHFQTPREPGLKYQVSIEREEYAETHAGTFENIVTLIFDDPLVVDEGHVFSLAPGVGIIRAYDGMGEFVALYSATVGGQVITKTERTGPSSISTTPAFASPNPFSTSTTLTVPFSGSQKPEIKIYNLLGRLVATLRDGVCSGDRCEYEWNGSQLPAGVYLVRFDQIKTIKVILSR